MALERRAAEVAAEEEDLQEEAEVERAPVPSWDEGVADEEAEGAKKQQVQKKLWLFQHRCFAIKQN